MKYAIIGPGESRSFPTGDGFRQAAVGEEEADIVVFLGELVSARPDKAAVLVELGTECLGVHTGEPVEPGLETVVGFARYRNGQDDPSPLVELVRRPETNDKAVAAARDMFEAAGLTVVVCGDQAGRIVDRLVRPKYNAALRFLDEGLATQKDLDLTCKLGLGYRDGPVERVMRGGLTRHFDVTSALFEVYGTPAYAPARAAVVAAARRDGGKD
ncbi:3-hydroxyacyl-CoA dehydrogenase family protein [Lutibaculum baratangense]|uniref:3-hydroxybutyryl-CoA dehydrogenase n=1 Tax=Lutibaculum baratangense AMV1 TaxID=631454 RepID=V4QVK3_9HYPH|nr:3-hydroxyacyl-CoA dehydrogenase family protein [Lutibaculum baratangense]ESR23792.1 3-hydroxybutyryl-CoA dehydrogenase [Lutibaculum baratangense AMV1]